MSCHDTPTPHPNVDASHTADPASQTVTISGENFGPVACADCHASPLLTTVHTGTCKTCHPTPKNTLTPAWDKSCAQGGCHTATSSAPMHASIDASHAPVAGQTCYDVGCHPAAATSSLAETHKNASAVLGGQTRTSCQVCHWDGTPASRECSSCHDPATPHGDLKSAHVATPQSGGVTMHQGGQFTVNCTSCHSLSLLAVHANDCALCHASTAANVTAAIQSWDGKCGSCHAHVPPAGSDGTRRGVHRGRLHMS